MLEPVEVIHRRDHVFQPRDRSKARKTCVVCGRGRTWIEHWGAPPSLNVVVGGGNRHAYENVKQMWQTQLIALMNEGGLVKPLQSVVAEGRICFPDRQGRDQGNFRFFVEKCLGDALVAGGWLEDDTFFPVRRYEFGGLEPTYEKGQSWLRILILPG